MNLKCSALKILLILLFTSIIFFIVSLILAFVVFPEILYSEVSEIVKLENGTVQYEEFAEPTSIEYYKIYLFHILNPDDVLQHKSKPNITQVGPFVYRQYRHKSVIYSDYDVDKISYTETRNFQFDSEKSYPFTEDYEVTTLNLPLMLLYQLFEESAAVMDSCISEVFPDKSNNIFIKIKAKEILFESFSFCTAGSSNPTCSYFNAGICNSLNNKLDLYKSRNIILMTDNSFQFSYFKYKLNSTDGKYTIRKGLNDIKSVGKIEQWNDLKYTEYWGINTTCSEVKGTDSTLYPPHITKGDSVFIYLTDICRYLQLNYLNNILYEGIEGYEFIIDSKSFYSKENNLENDCFCGENKSACYLNGIINLQTCNEIPLLLSFPHFLWGSGKYIYSVEGIEPDEYLHKTYVILEPDTGFPLKIVKRMQLNFPIRGIEKSKLLAQLPEVVLPLLWVEEEITPRASSIQYLKKIYLERVGFFNNLKWSLVAVSTVMVVAFSIIIGYKNYF